ncbi:MAG: hypothetical protein R3B89_00885 [Polyangiaceae bacterium]
MRAAAPGKLVLSGAYAVLHGAPALVTAVDRYVIADSAQNPDFLAPEVQAALRSYPGRQAPGFDADALRSQGKKLGLGSSAAITAASVAVWELLRDSSLGDEELAARVFPIALAAHREAQGGGSGIDVAAASRGGTLQATRRSSGELEVLPVELPPDLRIEVWWTGVAASTPRLLRSVASLEREQPRRFEALMGAQIDASERTARAFGASDAGEILRGLHAQSAALRALGEAAGAAIVSGELTRAAATLDPDQEVWLPAGAGGGDVLLRYLRAASTAPPPSAIERSAQRLSLSLGARGVHRRED